MADGATDHDPIFALALSLTEADRTIEEVLGEYRYDLHERYRQRCREAIDRVDASKEDPFFGFKVSPIGRRGSLPLGHFIAKHVLAPCLRSGKQIVDGFEYHRTDGWPILDSGGDVHGDLHTFETSSHTIETRLVTAWESSNVYKLYEIIGYLIGYFRRPVFDKFIVEIGVPLESESFAFYKVSDLEALMRAVRLGNWPRELSIFTHSPDFYESYLRVCARKLKIRIEPAV